MDLSSYKWKTEPWVFEPIKMKMECTYIFFQLNYTVIRHIWRWSRFQSINFIHLVRILLDLAWAASEDQYIPRMPEPEYLHFWEHRSKDSGTIWHFLLSLSASVSVGACCFANWEREGPRKLTFSALLMAGVFPPIDFQPWAVIATYQLFWIFPPASASEKSPGAGPLCKTHSTCSEFQILRLLQKAL